MKCKCGFQFSKYGGNHSTYLNEQGEWFRVCSDCGAESRVAIEREEDEFFKTQSMEEQEV
jgi:hypothetical protein